MDIHTSVLAWKVIGCAIEVHREIGPGMLHVSSGVAESYLDNRSQSLSTSFTRFTSLA